MAKQPTFLRVSSSGTRLETLANEYIALANESIAKLDQMVNSLAIFLRDLEHRDYPPYQGVKEKRDSEFYKLDCVVESAERILPVTMELAQAISQQIEHGSNGAVAKLAITLKLAELEASIRAMQLMLADKRVRQNYKSSN